MRSRFLVGFYSGPDNKEVNDVCSDILSLYSKYKDNDLISTELYKLKIGWNYKVFDKSSLYVYQLEDNSIWKVYDNNFFKITYSDNYIQHFNKKTGTTFRFGKTIDDDPTMCPLGPEILDLEISVNGCPKINGHNCKFCYKNNTDKEPINMSLDTFINIISRFPKNLNQIAFGITGCKTNPDFPKMIECCHSVFGIVPNYTLSGADIQNLNDEKSREVYEATLRYCGAIAVSCYPGAKELCYKTIKMFSVNNFYRWFNNSKKMLQINMHIVLSKDNMIHIMDVLNDIKNGKVLGLNSIVFLRIKPVGRASLMDTTITDDELDKVISFCEENNISYGFDSCSAHNVIKLYEKTNRLKNIDFCEPCESSRFSSYINVHGQYWHCSFCENNPNYKPLNVFDYDDFHSLWMSKELESFRNPKIKMSNSCQLYDLDLKGRDYEDQK